MNVLDLKFLLFLYFKEKITLRNNLKWTVLIYIRKRTLTDFKSLFFQYLFFDTIKNHIYFLS